MNRCRRPANRNGSKHTKPRLSRPRPTEVSSINWPMPCSTKDTFSIPIGPRRSRTSSGSISAASTPLPTPGPVGRRCLPHADRMPGRWPGRKPCSRVRVRFLHLVARQIARRVGSSRQQDIAGPDDRRQPSLRSSSRSTRSKSPAALITPGKRPSSAKSRLPPIDLHQIRRPADPPPVFFPGRLHGRASDRRAGRNRRHRHPRAGRNRRQHRCDGPATFRPDCFASALRSKTRLLSIAGLPRAASRPCSAR